jgi:hypothetical protein
VRRSHRRPRAQAVPTDTADPVTTQGARDVEQGKVDTDRYDATGPRYARTQKP